MKQFQLRTQVSKFEDVDSFVRVFGIGKGDFILASKSIYKKYFEELCPYADVAFRCDFGTGEPNDDMIDKIFDVFRKKDYNRIIAIGGGSVIDIAKLLVIKDAKCTIDVFGGRVPLIKDKQLIVIPTTCGSGSEVSCVSIAEIRSKGLKMGMSVEQLFPDVAALIPMLLNDLPYNYFINSSIDALIHATESFVSPKSNSYTELFSVDAIKKILNGFKLLVSNGIDYRFEIMDDFATASNYAGIAFGNTGTGAVHALSYPLSGTYHVEHGEANYQFFTEIFKLYNRKDPNGKIKEVGNIIADILGCGCENVYDEVQAMIDKLQTRKPLHEYGMREDEIYPFTDGIIKTQQRLLSNSYVPLSREEIRCVYQTLL